MSTPETSHVEDEACSSPAYSPETVELAREIRADNAAFQAAVSEAHKPAPKPVDFGGVPSNEEPILRFFSYSHLPEHLQPISQIFYNAAHKVVDMLPRCAERTVALRKMLEGKDAAVRAALTKE